MPSKPDSIIVTRAAVALPFALAAVVPDGRREILTGVLTWAAAGLDAGDRHDRVWLDLGMTRDQAEELLRTRVYDLD
jgi:hypothetical protein